MNNLRKKIRSIFTVENCLTALGVYLVVILFVIALTLLVITLFKTVLF